VVIPVHHRMGTAKVLDRQLSSSQFLC